MKGKHKRFADRLSANVLLITSILILVTLTIVALQVFTDLAEHSREDAARDLHTEILRMEESLEEAEVAVSNASWVVNDMRKDEEALKRITRQILLSNPYLRGASVSFIPYGFDPEVKYFAPYSIRNEAVPDAVFTFQRGSVDYDYPTMDWFQIPQLLGKPYWSDPYFDENNTGLQLVSYAYPLKDDAGSVYAVLSVDVALTDLIGLVDELKPYPNSMSLLVAKNGSFIYHPDKSRIMNSTIFSEPMEAGDTGWIGIARDMMAGKTGLAEAEGWSGRVLVVYETLRNGWPMALISPYRDIFRDSSRMINFLVIVAILSLLALFFVSRKMILRQTQPITEFSFAALSMAKGNFQSHIPEVASGDEMQNLHDSLEYMQKSVSSYIAELKATTASNERYAGELDIARKIQLNMLPDFRINDGRVGLHAVMCPAKEVGGDLFDYQIRDKYLYFLVGDVSGKGVPAALFMAITRAAFRFISGLGLDISKIVGRVNNTLAEGNKSTMFVTLFAGKLDLETLELHFCNAGHNPVVIVPPGGKPYFLKVKPNIACGLFEGFAYESESITLEKGTRLFVYTDGVTEAEKADKSQYGEDRLLEWAAGMDRYADEEAAVEGILSELRTFAAGNEQNDDITAMAITLK